MRRPHPDPTRPYTPFPCTRVCRSGNVTDEHSFPRDIFYTDLVQRWGQTKVYYTPTRAVTYGGPAGDPYWRAHTNVWEHPILTKHIPPAELAANNKRRA